MSFRVKLSHIVEVKKKKKEVTPNEGANSNKKLFIKRSNALPSQAK